MFVSMSLAKEPMTVDTTEMPVDTEAVPAADQAPISDAAPAEPPAECVAETDIKQEMDEDTEAGPRSDMPATASVTGMPQDLPAPMEPGPLVLFALNREVRAQHAKLLENMASTYANTLTSLATDLGALSEDIGNLQTSVVHLFELIEITTVFYDLPEINMYIFYLMLYPCI